MFFFNFMFFLVIVGVHFRPGPSPKPGPGVVWAQNRESEGATRAQTGRLWGPSTPNPGVCGGDPRPNQESVGVIRAQTGSMQEYAGVCMGDAGVQGGDPYHRLDLRR